MEPRELYQKILILFFVCFLLFIVENFPQAKAKGFHNEPPCNCHSASIMLNLKPVLFSVALSIPHP